jgi:hypothetical protein
VTGDEGAAGVAAQAAECTVITAAVVQAVGRE